jgi:hypothetical protein
MSCSSIDWIDLAQDLEQRSALVSTVMNLRVKYNVGKLLSSCTTGSFSRRAQLHRASQSFIEILTAKQPHPDPRA